MVEYRRSEGKRRSLAGNVGLGFFAFSFILIFIAFCTTSWLVSDRRITGANMNRLGLWTHCFRSLNNPYNKDQFFVGCRWLYDPFTSGYDEIRGLLAPGFMITTQIFFTFCFLAGLVCAILSLLYFLCWGPEQDHFTTLVQLNSYILLAGGLSGGIAVVVFAIFGNRNGWMPGHENNFFGYSFVLACVGSVSMLIAASLFLTDLYIHKKKKKELKESQSRFNLEARG
ncbi:uncharacterized protein LOC123677863 [Harmonia axyridis]|uniref:uncharacterized protein LOC123677863 n=1 Tax=Harmonia axyridis TaxID=115357 RepID=UPI001E277F42|nr:uncharacterized protein LOC123677863 [Harmonia axyridis]